MADSVNDEWNIRFEGLITEAGKEFQSLTKDGLLFHGCILEVPTTISLLPHPHQAPLLSLKISSLGYVPVVPLGSIPFHSTLVDLINQCSHNFRRLDSSPNIQLLVEQHYIHVHTKYILHTCTYRSSVFYVHVLYT